MSPGRQTQGRESATLTGIAMDLSPSGLRRTVSMLLLQRDVEIGRAELAAAARQVKKSQTYHHRAHACSVAASRWEAVLADIEAREAGQEVRGASFATPT